jgi:hypothetical protein
MRAPVVKRACWIDPVTCWLAAGLDGTVVVAFPSLLPVCAVAPGRGSSWSARRAGPAGAGEDERAWGRQAAADHRERGTASCGVGVCGGRWLVSPARVVVGVGLTCTHSAPAWWRVAMTVTPGTGLLSQGIERGEGRLMRSRELTRGWRPSRLAGRTAAGGVGEQMVGAGEQLAGDRGGGDLGAAAPGDALVAGGELGGVLWECLAFCAASHKIHRTQTEPCPGCARAGRCGPSRGRSG